MAGRTASKISTAYDLSRGLNRLTIYVLWNSKGWKSWGIPPLSRGGPESAFTIHGGGRNFIFILYTLIIGRWLDLLRGNTWNHSFSVFTDRKSEYGFGKVLKRFDSANVKFRMINAKFEMNRKRIPSSGWGGGGIESQSCDSRGGVSSFYIDDYLVYSIGRLQLMFREFGEKRTHEWSEEQGFNTPLEIKENIHRSLMCTHR